MNKNVILALLGVGVFVVICVVLWGAGNKGEPPPVGPAPTPAPAPAPETKGEAPEPETAETPEKPAEQPGEVKPAETPEKPGEVEPGETAKPEKPGEVENPEPGETPAPPQEADEVEAPSLPPARITSDPNAVDEEKRLEAAGNQELPVKWLGEKDGDEVEGGETFPKTYVLPKTMSLYRVAEIIYGDADKWQLLFQANKAILEDPEKVEAGTELAVPDPSLPAAPARKKKSRLSDGLF